MNEKLRDYLVQLNAEWMRVFDHSYTQCYQLSLLDGEIGELHRKHIEFVAGHVDEQSPQDYSDGAGQ